MKARRLPLSVQWTVELIDDKSRTMGFYIGEHGKNRVMIGWKEYDARW
jgi:hypothetical protein